VAGAGVHTITYTYTDVNGCTNSATQDLMVYALPVVTFEAIPPVFLSTPAFDLTQGLPAGGTYSGPGITISPTFDPATAGLGTHTIIYTYTDVNGCTNTASQTLTVNVFSAVTFGPIPPVCLNTAAFDLTQGSPAGGIYSGPGITTSPTFDPAVAGAGIHTLTYTYTDGGGYTDSATQTIIVYNLPTVVFDAVPSVCVDGPVFDITQGLPAGGTYSGPGITVSPSFDPGTAGAGIHTITYTYTDGNGCTNSATQDIMVHQLPTVTFEAIPLSCVGAAAFDLTQGSPAGGVYSGPGITVSPAFDPNLSGEGIHTITYTYTDVYGCANSATQTVTVSSANPELGEDRGICQGESIEIQSTGTFVSYLWHDGSTGQVYVASTQGMIRLTVTDEDGCIGKDSIYLTVHPLPYVNLGEDATLCGTESLVLDGGTDGTQFTWSTGENTRFITVYEGQKTICVEVRNEFNCVSRDTIVINECSLDEYFKNIPNAFTPNADGRNDTWRIPELEAFPQSVVEIYSRWGVLVFRSEPGYSNPWDGTYNGKEMPMDSYYFIITLNIPDAKPIVGYVTLIR